jgi:hypothetical protein
MAVRLKARNRVHRTGLPGYRKSPVGNNLEGVTTMASTTEQSATDPPQLALVGLGWISF